MYMNKNKRNLILAAAIINLIQIVARLVLSVIAIVNPDALADYQEYLYYITISTNIIYVLVSFIAGLVGSIFLLYSVRSKGKYFRQTRGIFIAGFVIIIVCGGYLPWLLLFISLFIPDVVIINSNEEIRREYHQQQKEDKEKEAAYEVKKKKIEDLKRMRDEGVISEDEYKQKLFDLL